MKHFLILIAALCLLTGCAGDTPPETVTPTPEVSAAPTPLPTATPLPISAIEPGDGELVRIRDYLPEAAVQLAYATEENFTGKVIYDFTEPWLRYGTVKKLMAVQEDLGQQGYALLIWDGYRPHTAQEKLWKAVPNPNYVSDPTKGYSGHSRGNTLDVSLVHSDGSVVEMPTGFDEFTAKADRDYSDVSETAAANARLLEETMTRHGFRGYSAEWWHYTDTTDYAPEELLTVVLPAGDSRIYIADCKEFITLRTAPDFAAGEIFRMPKNERMELLGLTGDFARVQYGTQQGYVAAGYIQEDNR